MEEGPYCSAIFLAVSRDDCVIIGGSDQSYELQRNVTYYCYWPTGLASYKANSGREREREDRTVSR